MVENIICAIKHFEGLQKRYTKQHKGFSCGYVEAALIALYEKAERDIKINEPFAIYSPRLFIDGDQWCALYGENIQDGVAGFGDSPEKAVADFNRNWRKCLPCREVE